MPDDDLSSTATARPGGRRGAVVALLLALAVAGAGLAGGALLFFVERAVLVRPLSAARSDGGWVVVSHGGRRGFAGLAADGDRVYWQYGATIECLDLRDGRVHILGPGAGMRATWAPAAGGGRAVWFEARLASAAEAEAVAYDAGRGRRRVLCRLRDVYSLPGVSGDTAVWCDGVAGRPQVVAVPLVGAPRRTVVADGYGVPWVADGLVVWTQGERLPFFARDLGGSVTWTVTVPAPGRRLAGWALAGRTVVCAVVAVPVDGGRPRVLARDVPLLAGPASDGRLAAWALRDPGGGSRVVARRLDLAPPLAVAAVSGVVSDVAVAGSRVAFLVHAGAGWRLEVREVAP